MNTNYPLVHVTKSSLVQDLKNLADDYKRGAVTNEEMEELLSKWVKNTPNYFFSSNENGEFEKQLSKRIRTLLGEKRALIIQTFLDGILG